MHDLIKAINNFVFPYSYLQSHEFSVSKNLMPWDAMLKTIS
jgi:hypothetical protein